MIISLFNGLTSCICRWRHSALSGCLVGTPVTLLRLVISFYAVFLIVGAGLVFTDFYFVVAEIPGKR